MIILRGVNQFPTRIEEIALGIPGLSPHFQLEITRPGRMDELAVKIERRAAATAQVQEPEALPRFTRKLRRIHDVRHR